MLAVEAGVLSRDDVAHLGDVLIGTAEGRGSYRDITVFDSTGLAIQDLAIALAAMRAFECRSAACPLRTSRESAGRASADCRNRRRKRSCADGRLGLRCSSPAGSRGIVA